MRILVDAHLVSLSGADRNAWAMTIAALSNRASVSDPNEIFVLTDGRDLDGADLGTARIVDFAHRDTPFQTVATEADLITEMCRTLDIDVFVTAGNSYQWACPSVAVLLGSTGHASGASQAVAWVLAHQFVTRSERDRDELRRECGFIRDEDVHVARVRQSDVYASATNLAEKIDEACRRAASPDSAARAVLSQPEITALVRDYQSRIQRIQI